MADFIKKCKNGFVKAFDRSFLENAANVVLVLVAALLLISLLVQPFILVALALFGLFVWALLSC
ncbi:MAG: hypothetical protein IK116_06415 [Firmicutes bacterium]|nr:hypothetical protein [Bacillota bacterium]